jgi:hypothetical protein
MRTAINSFFVIFTILGIAFSCETNDIKTPDPKSFYELNGQKLTLSQAFMDVTESDNGNYVFEVYLLGNGLAYNLTDDLFEESGDIIQFSLVLDDLLIPSGSSSFVYEEWSDEPQLNTFIYGSLRTNCDSGESCNGLFYHELLDGIISIKKVNTNYEIEFSLMFTDQIIEGQYSGIISRRDN